MTANNTEKIFIVRSIVKIYFFIIFAESNINRIP